MQTKRTMRLEANAPDHDERRKGSEPVRARAVALSQEILMHKDGNQVVETAVEARGGLLGKPVLVVLIVSCVLAIGLLGMTYAGMI